MDQRFELPATAIWEMFLPNCGLCDFKSQRQRDDNKNKICAFEGGGPRGQRGKLSKNAVFRGKRHHNKIIKVNILLSRNFVVVAQAPKIASD